MNLPKTIHTLTSSKAGHTLHHQHVFSPDDAYIVFDGRNDETKIGETAEIGVVQIASSTESVLFRNANQTMYGPGVGAASFHPHRHRVVCIKGLASCSPEVPYAMSRRIGWCLDLEKPQHGFHLDARAVLAPYPPGSLRGGTHSHGWSASGELVSFTYNDAFVDADLRVVGVMVPSGKPILVDEVPGNNSGEMYSAIVSEVVSQAAFGSDEIEKAFDECWLGVKNTIAFQGNTRNAEGALITEIFLVDIDVAAVLRDADAVGQVGERPKVPVGIQQRRLSRTSKGLSNLRHWLRASADGRYVYALAKDNHERNQLIQCDALSGDFTYISAFDFSIDSPINISYKGDKLTFIAQNNVFIYRLADGQLEQLTHFAADDLSLAGVPVFSRSDKQIAFNQFVEGDGDVNLQVKLIQL